MIKQTGGSIFLALFMAYAVDAGAQNVTVSTSSAGAYKSGIVDLTPGTKYNLTAGDVTVEGTLDLSGITAYINTWDDTLADAVHYLGAWWAIGLSKTLTFNSSNGVWAVGPQWLGGGDNAETQIRDIFHMQEEPGTQPPPRLWTGPRTRPGSAGDDAGGEDDTHVLKLQLHSTGATSGWAKLWIDGTLITEGATSQLDFTGEDLSDAYLIMQIMSGNNPNNPVQSISFLGIKVNDILIAVELASFEAAAINNAVHLSWSTATETENLGFHIYRSMKADGDYIQINAAIIPGAGNSAEAHNYSYTDRNVEIGTTYYYKLADVDFNGNLRFHGPVSATVLAVPEAYALQQNYPNPFNPETAISYSLKSAGAVKLTIINNLGQIVRMLVDAQQQAGSHSVLWNGRDDQGRLVATGVYVYRLEVNGFSEVRKLVFSK